MTRKWIGFGLVAGAVIAASLATMAAGGFSARPSRDADAMFFQPCRAGEKGGGYRVRATGVGCGEVRRLLPKMFARAQRLERRESESVYRTRRGFTCLVQAGPERRRYTVILCVRHAETIFYRAA